MKFHYTDLEDCHTAQGVVIVIDVLRAFSTAAYAFSRGAKEILLVSSVEEALLLGSQIPSTKVMGEVGGLPPEGFDFGNSPTHINKANLSGITLVQRTGAGTQGVVRSIGAEQMLASSFVIASATVKFVKKMEPDQVTFVITGKTFRGGDEDFACAEYLEELFRGNQPETKPFIQRVYNSRDAIEHLDPLQKALPLSDLDYCTRIDRFDFAMPITRQDGRLIMRCVKP